MYCKNCFTNIPQDTQNCPNCGTPNTDFSSPLNPNQYAVPTKINALAIAGFIVTLVSLAIQFHVVGVVGTIISIVGLVQIVKRRQKGKAFAITGIVLGSISTILCFIQIIAIIAYVLLYQDAAHTAAHF